MSSIELLAARRVSKLKGTSDGTVVKAQLSLKALSHAHERRRQQRTAYRTGFRGVYGGDAAERRKSKQKEGSGKQRSWSATSASIRTVTFFQRLRAALSYRIARAPTEKSYLVAQSHYCTVGL